MMTGNVTAIVLTVNEEQDISRCLNSLAWADNIIIVDSGSTDNTLTIAEKFGCDIYENDWPGFAAQRNWALEQTNIETDWALFVDADEVIADDLVSEMLDKITDAGKGAFYLCFKVILFETWVKRSANFPVWHPRLCRVGAVSYKNAVTGHGETWDVDGEIGYIHSPYIHYNFSKGFTHWLHKHNRLSSMECTAFFENEYSFRQNVAALFAKDAHKKRQALRQLSFRIPGRPFIRFFYSFIVKGGFLEGKAGLTYCLLYLIYELMIQVKMIERRFFSKRDSH